MSSVSDSQNRLIVEHLQRAVDGVVAVYLFGSIAQGVATESSDLDVAVLARARLSPELRFDVQEELATLLERDVDLVDLAGASTVMTMQVISRGQLLYDDESGSRGQFEDLAFSAYARLNEERRGILDRVAAEGTIYGR